MTGLLTLAAASFRELIRQPFYLLLLAGGAGFLLLLSNLSYFALGEENRQAKQSALAFMLLAGVFASVFGASASVAREVRTGTALVVLSKPVGRVRFLAGKFLGLGAGLALLVLVHGMVTMLSGRTTGGRESGTDWVAVVGVAGGVVGGLGIAGCGSYFAHRGFRGDAVLAVTAALGVVFVAVNFMAPSGAWQRWGQGLDMRLGAAGLLVLFAVWALAGMALALSTRLEMVPTLVLCTGLLGVGLLSDYLFAGAAASGSSLAAVLHGVVPDWQVFWMGDALGEGREIPWSYVARAGAYAASLLGVALPLGVVLFADRELG
jgi:hypothetical protein